MTLNALTDLLIVAPADVPLTPAQRKFNQLLAKIEQARSDLAAWQTERDRFAQTHLARTRPLLAEIGRCRLEAAEQLHLLSTQGKWAKSDRRMLDAIVRDVVSERLTDDDLSADLSADEVARLKALHDAHAEVDFDTGHRASMAELKGMFEAMSGLNLGDETFESEDDLRRRARERIQAERAAEAQRAEEAPPRPARKPTAAQRRRQAKAQADAEAASQSVREVYRKLASALHPDRAADEADRQQRTALMQRVNRAYEAQDLLTLFALQLEIEQVDAAHLSRTSAERAARYNQLLSAQLADLNSEIEACELAFIAEYGFDLGLDPNDSLQPSQLGRLLDRHIAELKAVLAQARQDLAQLHEPVSAKRWLKRLRQQQKHPSWADDDALFA